MKDKRSAHKTTGKGSILICIILVAVCAIVTVLPAPRGLTPAGQRVLSIAILSIGFWSTEVLPMGVTGMIVIILLVISKSVSGFQEALYGFAQPVAYFLIGVLTIGLAVLKSGLAERIAHRFLQTCKGNPRKLYLQLVASFRV